MDACSLATVFQGAIRDVRHGQCSNCLPKYIKREPGNRSGSMALLPMLIAFATLPILTGWEHAPGALLFVVSVPLAWG